MLDSFAMQVQRFRFSALQIGRLAAESNRLVRIQAQTPQLAPLVMAILMDRQLSSHRDLVWQVKQLLSRAGVSEAVWRLVANGPCDFFAPVWHIGSDAPGKSAIAWCRILTAGKADWVPPATLVDGLFASAPRNRRGRVRIGALRWKPDDLPLLRAALREGKRRHAEGSLDAFVKQELLLVDAWWRSEWPVLDENQQSAGWPWLLRQARLWSERREEEINRSSVEYRVPLDTFSDGTFAAKAVRTSFELWLESVAMRHCVDSYDAVCGSGDCLIYSIRDAATGKRLATVSLRSGEERGAWRVGEVVGFANGAASKATKRFARQLAAACAKSRRSWLGVL
jgi:hypothetical protein